MGTALIQQATPPTERQLRTCFTLQQGLATLLVAAVYLAAPALATVYGDAPPELASLFRLLALDLDPRSWRTMSEVRLVGDPVMSANVLLVKGISGLGDRILCALTGSLYARLSKRTLIIDWRDEHYSSGSVNAFHHFFLSRVCDPTDEVPETDSVVPAIWRGHLHESASSMRERYGSLNDAQGWRMFSIDLARLHHPEQVAVLWTYGAELDPLLPHLEPRSGPLAGASGSTVLRTLIRETLELHPRIRERVDRFQRDHFDGRTVGVHIRYSDHRTAVRTTLQALHRILDHAPSSRIFLCTDNIQVRRLFEKNYDDVISTPHWYDPTPGRPLHYGGRRPDPLETGAEALVDLYLLARCDDLIVDTSSSFAKVATLLTNTSASRVVDVKRRDKLPPRLRHASTRLMRRLRAHSWAPGLIAMLVRRHRTVPRGRPAGPGGDTDRPGGFREPGGS